MMPPAKTADDATTMITGRIETNEEDPKEDPDLSQWEKLQKWIYPFLGILCAASAALSMAGQNVIVKTLSHVSPLTITAVRFAVIFLMSSPIAVWPLSSQSQPELPIPSGKWKIFQLVMRCVLGASNIMIHFYALQVTLNFSPIQQILLPNDAKLFDFIALAVSRHGDDYGNVSTVHRLLWSFIHQRGNFTNRHFQCSASFHRNDVHCQASIPFRICG